MKADDESITLEDEDELNLIEKGLSSSNSLSDETKQVLEETKSRAHSINFENIHAEMKLPKELYKLLEKNANEKGIGMAALLGEIMTSYVEADTSSSEEEKKSLIKLIQENPIELENYVLSEIENKHLSPITHGTEGEIYKLEIEKKSYVVVKKRYSHTHKNEFTLLKRAKEIQEEINNEINTNKNGLPISKNGNRIKIPAPIGSFIKNDSEYIMMEYIDGKTLYTMTLEKLLEFEFINYFRKISDENKLKEYIYNLSLLMPDLKLDFTKEFYSYSSKDIIKNICNNDGTLKEINFSNDTEAENQVLNFYSFLYENGYISENPSNQKGEHNENLFLLKKYKENIQKLTVFNESTGLDLTREIKYFLGQMHKKGIYHRDLGQNPRNIMFKKLGENNYETYIIDFGKGIITSGENDSVYNEHFIGGKHDNDEFITSTIQLLSSDKKNNKLFDKNEVDKLSKLEELGIGKYKLDKGALLSNLKNLYSGISQGYKISLNHVLPIINRHNTLKRNSNDKYLFIEGIDRSAIKSEKIQEINKYSNDVKIELIGYLSYMNEDDFEKLGEYLQNLDLSNMGKKAEGYKNFFLDLYNDIKEIR